MEPLLARFVPSTIISLLLPFSCRSRRILISSLWPFAVQDME
jgi:hypothetical protein